MLQQELQLYDAYQTQIAACDQQIEQCLSEFDVKVDLMHKPLPLAKYKQHKPQDNQPGFDLRTHLYRMSGIDFTQIDGMGILTVQTILSEVGLDPSRFPTVKHFTSWLGLCPGSRITGGKVKSSATRQVVNRAANAFRMAATLLLLARVIRLWVLFIDVYVLVLVLPKRLPLLPIKSHAYSTKCG